MNRIQESTLEALSAILPCFFSHQEESTPEQNRAVVEVMRAMARRGGLSIRIVNWAVAHRVSTLANLEGYAKAQETAFRQQEEEHFAHLDQQAGFYR